MTTDIIDVLKGLLSEDETIYEIVRCAASPVYIIGPVVDDIERKLDLGGCIENTLHRMLDAECGDELILEALHAANVTEIGEEIDSGTYYIDLGYIIYDFYPVQVINTGHHYKRPSHEQVVHFWDKIICSHLEIPDDPTDEEVLEIVSSHFGLNQDELICEDVRNDGTMIAVQNVLDDGNMIILMQKKNTFTSANPFDVAS